MNKNNLSYRGIYLLTACLSSAVSAQQAEGGAEGKSAAHPAGPIAAIETVVVTSRLKEEDIQTTPLAVTALGSEQLETMHTTNLFNVQNSTPGLLVGGNTGGGGNMLSLRGQGQINFSAEVDQAVGLYIDNVYLARQQDAILDLVDVERVEVLRGPQGTLFGRNTTGGAVSITNKKPTNVLEGFLEGTIGNFDTYQATGMINVPFTDAVAGRFVYKHSEHSGYGENRNLNRELSNDNTDFFRSFIKIDPADSRWSILLGGDYRSSENDGTLSHVLFANPAVFAGPIAASGQAAIDAPFYSSMANAIESNNIKNYGGLVDVSVDLDFATLRSITSHRRYKHRSVSDLDATDITINTNLQHNEHEQTSQEFQLAGKTENLDWIAGFYYFRESTHTNYNINDNFVSLDADITSQSTAPFAQANYNITDKLRLTLGARYTKDSRHEVVDNNIPAFGNFCLTDPSLIDPGEACSATRKRDFEYLSYTASLDYALTSDIFLYARTGKGNKSGGISSTSASLEYFDPEKVVDYEVGTKATFFDRRLQTNLALFSSDYRDFQRPVLTVENGIPQNKVQSVGHARINGVEFEMTVVPFEGMELTGNYAYLDPKYLEFSDASGDRTGEPFTFVAKNSWGVGAVYKISAEYGEWRFNTDYAYRSQVYFFPPDPSRAPANPAAVAGALEPGYGLLNAGIGLALANTGVDIALWGKNLNQEKYNTFRFDLYNSGVITGYRGDPRTFGMTATYRF